MPRGIPQPKVSERDVLLVLLCAERAQDRRNLVGRVSAPGQERVQPAPPREFVELRERRPLLPRHAADLVRRIHPVVAQLLQRPVGDLARNASSRQLLPDPVAGLTLERMELPAGAAMTGIPHTPGTREYLTCETGEVELTAGGQTWRLAAGDVVVFRGDQKHGYRNPGRSTAIAYSVIAFAPSAG